MPADLLFELGCEEIPAKMLARALAELPAMVEAKLAAARVAHKGVRALGTPRRLAVIVQALEERQPDLHEEVVGPPLLGGHFGVIGMRERAERIGGELRLDSRRGEGTSIELRVPLA